MTQSEMQAPAPPVTPPPPVTPSPDRAPPAAPVERQEGGLDRPQRIERWFEALTALMLGVVAVATAWSGYQAARWSGQQAAHYSQASALRVESTRASTRGGQLRLYDLNLVDSWLSAYILGNAELAAIYQRRFRPEFVPVFQAWLALDPLHNPAAPPGPLFMPQYESSLGDDSADLEAQAARTFAQGQDDNEQSDAYVLNTVFLAAVLFLTAIADRFRWNTVRAMVLGLALVLLLYGLYHLVAYPIV